jgi:hypothetical protein
MSVKISEDSYYELIFKLFKFNKLKIIFYDFKEVKIVL